MSRTNQLLYLPHLDTYRAIAVLLVVLYHLDVSGFSGGFLGVDVFFVISGYLISRIIKHEYNTNNTFRFRNFYWKRIRRLLPSLLLMTCFSFLLSFLLFSPKDFIDSVQSIFTATIATSNFYFLGETGYFDEGAKLKPLLHTWSLGIEEQFYLIWPFIFLLILRCSSQKILLFVLFLTSFLLTIYVNLYNLPDSILSFFGKDNNLTSSTKSVQFYLLPFRAYEFLLGAILNYIPQTPFKSSFKNTLLHIIGLLLILAPSFLLSKETPFISSLNIIPCIGIAILLIVPSNKLLNKLYNVSSLQLIGKSSYTWYLFHWPCIVFYLYLYEIDRALNLMEIGLLFLTSLVFSILIYTYYEIPLRYYRFKEKSKTVNRYIMSSVLAIIFTFFLLQKHISNSNGWLWRLEDRNQELAIHLENFKEYKYNNFGCKETANNIISTDQWIGKLKNIENEQADMIWFGDSHCGHYTYGIDSILVSKNKKDVYMGYYSALMLPDVRPANRLKREKATQKMDNFLRMLEENKTAIVVISYHWLYQLKQSQVSFDDKKNFIKGEFILNNKEKYQFLTNQIIKFHELIDNRKLIVIGASPFQKDAYRRFRNTMRPKYLRDMSSTQRYLPYFAQDGPSVKLNDYFKSKLSTRFNLLFIDPSLALCPNKKCFARQDNIFFYTDPSHLSKAGSLKVIRHYQSRILAFEAK